MRQRVLLLAIIGIFCAGCAHRLNCPACSVQDTHQYACDANTVNQPGDTLEGFDMLFLSGGGSFGAYGAGVLNGWSEVKFGEHVRKEFKVVTGISTGSLQATHAFLGEAYDSYLYENYTNADKVLMPRRHWWQIPFSSSINVMTGLIEVLEDTVPNEMIDTVAAQKGKRLLCIGTTNLDSSEFVTWDMTKIASEGKYDMYRSILLASASVPAASPPVNIGGSFYGDGGVRHQIFSVSLVKQLRRNRAEARDRAYFLVNDQLSVQAQCTQKRILPIAERTIGILITEGLASSLWEAEVELKRCGSQSGNLEMYYLYIPDDYAMGFSNSDFNKDQMCRLFCRGRFDGKQGNWSGCRPSRVGPRSCALPIYPPGDTLKDSYCPASGDFVCPENSVYAPIPATCGSPMDACMP